MTIPEHNPDDVTRTHLILSPGSMVQHYRIIEKIGAGGMGEVFLAEDTKLNRRVALKFLPAHMAQDAELRVRFTREAQAAAKLDHPNIVTIHEVGEHNGNPFFAMQYIDGKTLQTITQNETLPVAKIVQLIAQVSDGLAKAHSGGVTHRDIKSANIIVDSDFRPKILDFGLATIQGGEMLTKAGSTLGTIAYMSPEQVQGREIDHRSDLFSLGIVLYELIAGRTPFKRNNDAAALHAIVSESPEPLARYKADVTPELQRIVSKSLAKNPAERYQSAADFASDLRAAVRSSDSGEHRTSTRLAASRPSIAVLPFANMSADPENEYFSDGLTEELLNMLAKNSELKVTGRTSSFAFKGKLEDLRAIGQKLGVETLLEGSVRRAGNRVRITAQLVSVADGFHLWSETYDRVLDDIFALQDDIATAVSKAMHVTLVGVTSEKKVVDPEAYALVLRAQHSALQMTGEGLLVAAELFNRAIEIDPTNARAWAGLSRAIGHQIAFGYLDYEKNFLRAKEAAEKAIALDNQLPQAHHAYGFVANALELDLARGCAAVRRAYELAPNDSSIVSSMSTMEMRDGNAEAAIRLAKKATELDPLNPSARRDLGRTLTVFGYYSEAREAIKYALSLSPGMATAYLGLAWIELLEGHLEEAARLIDNEKSLGYRLCGKAMVEWALGRIEESDRQLELLIAQGEQWGFQIACVYAYRKDVDATFRWLDRSWELKDSGLPLAKITLWFQVLHADPRWAQFLAKLG